MAPPHLRALSAVAAGISTAFVAVTAIVTVALRAEFIQETRLPPAYAAVELVCAASVVLAVWVALRRRPVASAWLGALAFVVCVPVWSGLPLFAPAPRAWAAAVVPLAIPCAAAALTTLFPTGGGRSVPRALIGSASLAGLSALVLGLGRNPALEADCARTCLNAPAILSALISTPAAIWTAAGFGFAAAVLGALAVTAERSGLAVIDRLIAVTGFLIAGIASAISASSGGAADWGTLAPFLLAGATAVAALTSMTRAARTRAWLRDSVETLRSESQDTLLVGGRIVPVQYAVPGQVEGSVEWVDGAGSPVTNEPEERRAWILTDAGDPSVRILGSSPATTASDLADVLTPAARLRLANARLNATARSRLRELRASQRRIVQTADAETHRIERDLHDGAQQHLVGAALYIEIARSATEDEDLSEAAAAVRTATAGLRVIARGSFPTLLRAEGLDAAVDELRRMSSVAMVIDGEAGELPLEVAGASYSVVMAAVDAVGSNTAGTVSLTLRRTDGALLIDLKLPAPQDPEELVRAVEDIADRVGALDGTLRRTAKASGWRIEAVIPCAS